MNKFFSTSLCLVITLMFCACQNVPQEHIVISKGDGSFNISIAESAEPDTSTSSDLQIVESSSFFSKDTSVQYSFKVNTKIQGNNIPIYEVTPHNITSEDAKKIALSLFEHSNLYEYDIAEPLSKRSIEEKMVLWSSYLSEDALRDLFGPDLDNTQIERWKNRIQNFLNNYSQLILSAPETITNIPCKWTFFPQSHYLSTENTGAAISFEKENLELIAIAESNNIPYKLVISNRNEEDYKIHNVFAFIYPGTSPGNLSDFIIQEELCKSPPPTHEQLLMIEEKSTIMLNNMGLGMWEIDNCYYDYLTFEGNDAYVVNVTAVPAFGNFPVIRQPQLNNLKSTEVYSSNYYYTDAILQFSPNGTLLSCSIYSPIDVAQTINNNVKTLDFSELNKIAKSNLALYSCSDFSSALGFESANKFRCNVTIETIEFGLTRVKVPNTNESYYYVPAATYKGYYQILDQNNDSILLDSRILLDNQSETLIVLNAIDGSVINVSNGY